MPGAAVDFYLIRHGETDWNVQGRLQGLRDIPLNPVGRDQAATAGRILKDLLRKSSTDPANLRFVASPLIRARDTMERVRRALGLQAERYDVDDRLQEIAFGDWEGLTWNEVKTIAPSLVRSRKQGKWGFVPPGGESYADLAERLRPWLAEVRRDDVVVAHGGVARALMVLIAGASPATAPDVEIHQGRVLRFAAGRWRWY